ncbi:uncharacterized protein EV420DRAFT_1643599 [Desarmillaria tabescens]|uniref:Uncharacterized protein n=1 Tax=Armillaria tabescens TaxID=1929756 RepID=A0AA39N528_ARMTA|nr:uncharacterized protein EV420DRAFT_1643599 [Desarmillaria tabescens]KAK0457743.1 hypothetical protein EV420DRAFT_1643599 [Desarmillaria tabescens]
MSAPFVKEIPTLLSLIQCADSLVKNPLTKESPFSVRVAWFDDAAKTQTALLTHYPRLVKESFYTEFEDTVQAGISLLNFQPFWSIMLGVETSQSSAAAESSATMPDSSPIVIPSVAGKDSPPEKSAIR